MTIRNMYWQWRAVIGVGLVAAVLPLTAGTIPLNSANSTKTDTGFFDGGTNVSVSVTGTIFLADNSLNTNPDGSLASEPSASCSICWSLGYQYFLSGNAYPTDAGGDGINHFVGGGANWDLFPSSGYAQHPIEGAISTNTTNPDVIRFGAVAGTWKDNPADNSADWFLVGSGGIFTAPAGGAHLYLIVVDTYYMNNTGSYTATVTPLAAVPEPSGASLGLAGVLMLAGFAGVRRRRTSRNIVCNQ
jgi:MYXO-CTERM domain-containing protein